MTEVGLVGVKKHFRVRLKLGVVLRNINYCKYSLEAAESEMAD